MNRPLLRPTLECKFYRSKSGHEPVRDWLKGLPSAVRQEIGSDILVVQWRWPLGPPKVTGLGEGLYEVRTELDRNIYRVMFCIKDSTLVLLHGFQKKTQKTPQSDLALARRRKREVENPP